MALKIRSILLTALFFFSISAAAYDSNPYAAASAVYKIEIQDHDVVHMGTGVLISRNKILTNCHVVRQNGVFRVIHQQTGQVFSPTSYYNLGNYDACILQGNFTQGTPVALSGQFEIGENVWHFGYPRNIFAFGQGVILRLVNTNQGLVIESGSFCNPGSSGSPLFNVKGELIGLNFGVRSQGSQDKCLSIPIANLLPFLQNN